MNNALRLLFVVLALSLAILSFTACGEVETPYDGFDKDGYTVSVKYDANGGTFTTNTSIIVDSYSYEKLSTDKDGNKLVTLIAPDDEQRGDINAYTATNNGYFLAGWYTERTEVLNDDGTVATYKDGNIKYTYGGRWDFEEDKLTLDKDKSYSSKEPVVTLYAAWVPNFTFEFYGMDGNPILNAKGETHTVTINPLNTPGLDMPKMSEETGAMDYYKFPKMTGKTFDKAYLGEGRTDEVTGSLLTHTGGWDIETATVDSAVTKVYVEYKDGVWYSINTAEQFTDNADMDGCYVINADLDFSDEIWSAKFAYGSFRGQIIGNGHTFSNITFSQSNAKTEYAGLFGRLSEKAVISDLKIENVSFNVKSGSTMASFSLGVFAGLVDTGATLSDLSISNIKLVFSDKLTLPQNYSVRYVVGDGEVDLIADGMSYQTTDDTTLYNIEASLGADGFFVIEKSQNLD